MFDDDGNQLINPGVQTHYFVYKNSLGIEESLLFAVHFTLTHDLQEVFEKAVKWYSDYCDWEDKKIINND